MTLLIFLASVAVMESIVKRAARQRDDKELWAREFYGRRSRPTNVPPPSAPATLGLVALGQALERHGCGEVPDDVPRAKEAGQVSL